MIALDVWLVLELDVEEKSITYGLPSFFSCSKRPGSIYEDPFTGGAFAASFSALLYFWSSDASVRLDW